MDFDEEIGKSSLHHASLSSIDPDNLDFSSNLSSKQNVLRVKSMKRKRNKGRRVLDEKKESKVPRYVQEVDEISDLKLAEASMINQPFHRIVFNEAGEACQVILRTQQGAQVNRKQQKRLGTSNYNWSKTTSEDLTNLLVHPLKSENLSPSTERAKNLQVCVHRFPSDYQTVVNYWYTTLEWLDKATYEASMESCECKAEEINPIVDQFTNALQADIASFPEITENALAVSDTQPYSMESCECKAEVNPFVDQFTHVLQADVESLAEISEDVLAVSET